MAQRKMKLSISQQQGEGGLSPDMLVMLCPLTGRDEAMEFVESTESPLGLLSPPLSCQGLQSRAAAPPQLAFGDRPERGLTNWITLHRDP